jgi:glutaredoxin-related protein
MIKVYGSDICIDCRELKEELKKRNITMDFISITENTQNMKEFLLLRDHDSAFEEVRQKEGGAIGIPCFVREDGTVTLDAEEAFSWVNPTQASPSI